MARITVGRRAQAGINKAGSLRETWPGSPGRSAAVPGWSRFVTPGRQEDDAACDLSMRWPSPNHPSVGVGPSASARTFDTVQSSPLERLLARPGLAEPLAAIRVGPSRRHGPPAGSRLAGATLVAVGASLAICAALAALGPVVFPSTRGYVHFRISDYGPLTVIGVLAACAAWPVVARISTDPRWLFSRLSVAVSAVLLLPDVYILAQGQPARAVAVLVLMHAGIAVVTYQCLVRLSPLRETSGDGGQPPLAEGRRPARV